MKKIYKVLLSLITVILMIISNTLPIFANANEMSTNDLVQNSSPQIVSFDNSKTAKSFIATMDPTSLTYIKYTDGNSLRFPIIRTNDGRYGYCIQHTVSPPSNAMYSYAGQLSNKIAVLLQQGINRQGAYDGNPAYMLGNESYDFYITQAGLKIFLGSGNGGVNDRYMSYSTGNPNILPNSRNLANLARSQSDAEPSIAASVTSDSPNFGEYGDNFATGVFWINATGAYESYTVSLIGANNDVQVINAYNNQNITGQNIPAGIPFRLSIPKNNAINMNISIIVTLNYKVKVANKYVTSGYQDLVLLEDKPKTAQASANTTLEPYGYLKLKKSSSDPTLTDGNDCYSLEGAEYGVYRNSNATDQVATLTTDINGDSNTIQLIPNTYYIKEIKAPKGYALDSTIHSINVSSNHTQTAPALLQVKDIPLMDPVDLLMKKIDSVTKESKSSSQTATLEGAEFTFKFYKNLYDTDPALSGQTPLRTWVFRTDSNGMIFFDDTHLISGDELYKDQNEMPSLPFGTLTIQETKSPEGYLLNDKIFVVPIKDGGSGTPVFPEVTPEIPETLFSLNLVKKQAGKDVVIPNAVFSHTRPDGTVDEYTTDQNGQLIIDGLQWGVHTIKEKTAPNGYLLNPAEIRFKVNEDNSIEILSNNSTDETGNITLEQLPDGNLSMTVEDKVIPPSLKIIKQNNKGQVLAGAEFTLYSDEQCTQVVDKAISDSKGEIKFNNIEIDRDYYLMETKAPKGYKLPIDENGNFIKYKIRFESIPAQNVFNFIVNDTVYNNSTSDNMFYVENNTGVMKVVNTINSLLPSTGSTGELLFTTIGTIFMVMSLAYFVMKKIKTKE